MKFGLPMAFTITMMAWSVLEYGKQMAASDELGHAMDAVKWGTDYFVKAHPEPNVLYGEVRNLHFISFCIILLLVASEGSNYLILMNCTRKLSFIYILLSIVVAIIILKY